MKNTAVASGMVLAFLGAAVWAQPTVSKSGAASLSPVQRAEIEQALLAAHSEIVATTNQLSVEGWAKYASADFSERVGGGNFYPTESGKAALLRWLAGLFAGRENQKWELLPPKVHVLSTDLAYTIAVGGASYHLKKSGRYGGFGHAFTLVWRREVGGWRFIHMHESSW